MDKLEGEKLESVLISQTKGAKKEKRIPFLIIKYNDSQKVISEALLSGFYVAVSFL